MAVTPAATHDTRPQSPSHTRAFDASAAPVRASRRAIEACAPFGIDAGGPPNPYRAGVYREDELPAQLRTLGPGQIALVTGESGSGKSTLVRTLAANVLSEAEVITPESRVVCDALGGCVIDRVGAPLPDATGLLARAGLAEARLFASSPATLSEGESFRFRLALAMERALAHQGSWLMVDEFASVLDRLTARSLCATLARWVRRVGPRAGLRLVIASAHEDLEAMLDADVIVRAPGVRGGAGSGTFGSGGATGKNNSKQAAVWSRAESLFAHVAPDPIHDLVIEPGTIADYDRLAHLHYRAGRPATRPIITRALVRHAGQHRLAGVLVVSMPTLNGAWRDLAWPGRYTSGDKRTRAERINAELRCISRVIVDTPCRGLGVGRALVEDYLRAPATKRTEALAAMGAACPFFERAGMRAFELEPSARDERWALALEGVGLRASGALACAHRAQREHSPASDEDRAVVARLAPDARRWCAGSPGTRKGLGDLGEAAVVARAAMGALARPIAYAHEMGRGRG